jgi:hypothetical protein
MQQIDQRLVYLHTAYKQYNDDYNSRRLSEFEFRLCINDMEAEAEAMWGTTEILYDYIKSQTKNSSIESQVDHSNQQVSEDHHR